MEAYDRELNQNTIDNQKTQSEYDDTYSDLLELKEEYKLRLQEKKKRDSNISTDILTQFVRDIYYDKLGAVSWVPNCPS